MKLAEVHDLAREIAEFRNDPLGFVRHCYPWGQGELSNFTGPDANQKEFLQLLGKEVRQRAFDGQRAKSASSPSTVKTIQKTFRSMLQVYTLAISMMEVAGGNVGRVTRLRACR